MNDDKVGNAGTLYMVATPIGHLADLTARAIDVLKSVQILAVEDTRRTRVLLDHIGHRVPRMLSLHDHNEAKVSEELVSQLIQGYDVAVVCDAGTPLINDPGFALVSEAFRQNIRIVPVPGASSITALLSVCPLPCQPFRFIGFLPSKAQARRAQLSQDLAINDALIFLEAPHRILHTLQDLQELTERRVLIGRELTKRHETLLLGSAGAVASQLGDAPKGEFIVLLEAVRASAHDYEHERVLRVLLDELPPTRAAKAAASICGAKKSQLYDLALSLKPAAKSQDH